MTEPPTPNGMQRIQGGLSVGTDKGGPVSKTVAGDRAHWTCLDCGNTTETAGDRPSVSCGFCQERDWARFNPEEIAVAGALLPSVELKRLADEYGSLRDAEVDAVAPDS